MIGGPMDLRRGDVVIIALQGEHGKPRPAVVVQANVTLDVTRTALVLPLTSAVSEPLTQRVRVFATKENGLLAASETMLERLSTIPKSKIGKKVGHVEPEAMAEIDNSLRIWLGLI